MRDIFTCLQAMFSNPSDRISWLLSLHPELRGDPLSIATGSPEGLKRVTEYLNYALDRGA